LGELVEISKKAKKKGKKGKKKNHTSQKKYQILINANFADTQSQNLSLRIIFAQNAISSYQTYMI
jgi:hypothetical protein